MNGVERTAVVALGIAVAVALGGWVPVGVTAQTGSAPTAVTGCTTIGTAGTYELTADISNSNAQSCITITATDVVIDGQGHTVDGTGSGVAIRVAGNATLSNVTVRDVTVVEWDEGVTVEDVHDGRVTGVNTSDNHVGLSITQGSERVAVNDSVVSANERGGIRIREASENTTVTNVTAEFNGIGAIVVSQGSPNTTVTDSQLVGNDVGLSVAGGSDGTHVAQTSIEDSSNQGVRVANSLHTSLASVTVLDSGTWDLYATGTGVVRATQFQVASAAVDLDGHAVALDAVPSPPAPPAGRTNVGGHVRATDTGTNPHLLLNVSYQSAAGVAEPTLRLWRHDSTWNQVASPNDVVTGANYVSANITTFSGGPDVFAPLGYTSNGTATPSPTPTPAPTQSPGPSQQVSDCLTITSPGTYHLTQDLLNRPETVCIDVRSDDVVFDGNGHTIDSDTTPSTWGIRVTSNGQPGPPQLTNVTVRNVQTTEWHRGIEAFDVDDLTVTDATVQQHRYGVVIWGSSDVTVSNVQSIDAGWNGGITAGHAVQIMGSSGVLVEEVDTNPGGIGGASVSLQHTNDVLVRDTTVTEADEAGLHVDDGSNATFRRVDVDGSDINGVVITGLHGGTVADSRFNDTDVGVQTYSPDTIVENVTTSHTQTALAAVGENVTARGLHLGNATTPTTVHAVGDNYRLEAVPSPPADPPTERNVSRYVRVVNFPGSWARLNVTYTYDDLVTANVGESTLATWVADSGWTQASGATGVNAADNDVYVNVTNPGGQVVAPLGQSGTGPTPTSGAGDGFGGLIAVLALVAVSASLAGLRDGSG